MRGGRFRFVGNITLRVVGNITLRECNLLTLSFLLLFLSQGVLAQGGYRTPNSPRNSQMKTFRQEIARISITIEREGHLPLPISLLPRIQKDDILRIQLVDEPINGIRPHESLWDWTLVVAFVNPSVNNERHSSLSKEIRFKKDGWYKEHVIIVPIDSQPIFFLYPKSNYRNKIKKFINKNSTQLQQIGEKTLEIADAYAQIGIFLNELQSIIRQNPYGYTQYPGNGYRRYPSNRFYGYQKQNANNLIQNQLVERLAQSFNIKLPDCWKPVARYGQSTTMNDFVSRAQCVAQNVRLEDFDFSVGRLIKQGGLLAASKLVERYPQLAHWISVAALAVDLIVRITKKTPVRVVPTLSTVVKGRPNGRQIRSPSPSSTILNPEKISVFSETVPKDSEYVSAFPIVVQRWQPNSDSDIIALPAPTLLEPCLHKGMNILKNTDLSYDWLRDPFAREFKLVISSENGYTKEFVLNKNFGISGWTVNIPLQDILELPNIRMKLNAKVVAKRGFKEIQSEPFPIPISGGGEWQISEESIKDFSIGGKRRIVITNSLGSAKCLQSVKFKPGFGGEFTFITNANANPLRFSQEGREAWFEIDTTSFKSGVGTLELRDFGINNAPKTLPLKLFPGPPLITRIKAHKGDRRIVIIGSMLNQISSILIDGKRAILETNSDFIESPSQKAFVFQNPSHIILNNQINIVAQLERGRLFALPNSFPVALARPTIQAPNKEVDAIVEVSQISRNFKKYNLSRYPVFSVLTEKISAIVNSQLTDYSFKSENLTVEARLEGGRTRNSFPFFASLEVLDSSHIKIEVAIKPNSAKAIAGRRIQFRLKDKNRGVSDWYTFRQTFVRVPEINSAKCSATECRIRGTGLEYIGRVSVDMGNQWLQPSKILRMENGEFLMEIPKGSLRGPLQIKLRDFPSTEGLIIK